MKDEDNDTYKLDKTAFSKMSFKEADDHVSYWKDKSLTERLNAAFYLINSMYGVNKHTPVDKTVFSKRKHGGPEIRSTSSENKGDAASNT